MRMLLVEVLHELWRKEAALPCVEAATSCAAAPFTDATAESRSSAWLKSQSAARSKLP